MAYPTPSIISHILLLSVDCPRLVSDILQFTDHRTIASGTRRAGDERGVAYGVACVRDRRHTRAQFDSVIDDIRRFGAQLVCAREIFQKLACAK
jgi:hypothetical protein